MQLLILAAGRGRRIKEISSKYPKCLIKINDETLLKRLINQSKVLKINIINLLLGYKYQKVLNYLKTKKDLKVNTFIFKNFKNNNNFLTLYKFRKLLSNKDTLISFSDIFLSEKILKNFKKVKKRNVIVFVDIRKIRKGTMKIKCSSNYLQYINVKDNKIKSDGNFIGLLYLPKSSSKMFIKELENNYPNFNKFYYVEVLNQLIAKKKKIKIFKIFDYWTEIDTISDLKKLKKYHNETL